MIKDAVVTQFKHCTNISSQPKISSGGLTQITYGLILFFFTVGQSPNGRIDSPKIYIPTYHGNCQAFRSVKLSCKFIRVPIVTSHMQWQREFCYRTVPGRTEEAGGEI